MLETGVVLIAVPWSTYWERNLFLEWLPALEAPLTNHFVRGTVSGLGVVNVGVGLFDLAMFLLGRTFARSARRPTSSSSATLPSSNASPHNAPGDA